MHEGTCVRACMHVCVCACLWKSWKPTQMMGIVVIGPQGGGSAFRGM